MAVLTERVMLGTAVTPLARRRPWVLARQVITFDHLSGGRAVLGIGLAEPADADSISRGPPGVENRPGQWQQHDTLLTPGRPSTIHHGSVRRLIGLNGPLPSASTGT